MSIDVSNAIGKAVSTFFKAIAYAGFFIPLGIFCIFLAFVSLPLDVIAFVFSGGNARGNIFKAFMNASGACFSWFRDNI